MGLAYPQIRLETTRGDEGICNVQRPGNRQCPEGAAMKG